jgi:IS30 family transposase
MTYRQLSLPERQRISALKQLGMSHSQIATELGRNRTTISREIRRNSCNDGRYRVDKADSRSRTRRRLPTRNLRLSIPDLHFIETKLAELWSPQQIAEYGKLHHVIDVSHETIYRHIRQNKFMGGNLWRFLRTARKQKRKRYRAYDSRGRLQGKRSIDERTPEINQRLTLGHWEGDTVMGNGKHCILTLVERKTGYLVIGKLTSRTVTEVNRVACKLLKPIQHLVKSITFDNGTEFHGYKELEQQLHTTVYFAHPHHSWERGTNENTNGLIRQILPKRVTMRRR